MSSIAETPHSKDSTARIPQQRFHSRDSIAETPHSKDSTARIPQQRVHSKESTARIPQQGLLHDSSSMIALS